MNKQVGNSRSKRVLWGNLTIALVALMVGLVLVEVGLAIFFPFPDYFIKPEPYIVDPVLVHRFKGDAELFQNGEIFYTDTHGFRIFDPESVPRADDKVIQFIGDSQTFGWMLKTEDTFVYQTEAQLRELGYDIRSVNASTPGWNLWHYQILYDMLLDFYPNRVALVLYIAGTDYTSLEFHDVEGGNLTSRNKSDAASILPKSVRVYMSRFHSWRYLTVAYRNLRDLSKDVKEEDRDEVYAAKWVEEVEPLEYILEKSTYDGVPLIVILDESVTKVAGIMELLNHADVFSLIMVDDLEGGRSHDDHIDAEKHDAITSQLVQLLEGLETISMGE